MRRLAEHSGRAAARNVGLSLSSGRYVAMCDSDDISLPHRFATQVAFLDAHPEVDVLSGHMMMFHEGSAPRRSTTYPEEPAEINRRFRKGQMGVVHGASMIRARCFASFGGYREELKRAEDFEFFRRIQPFCRFRNLPEVLLLYRHEVTWRPWWKWVETSRFHRYARYLSNANGRSASPVMSFDDVLPSLAELRGRLLDRADEIPEVQRHRLDARSASASGGSRLAASRTRRGRTEHS